MNDKFSWFIQAYSDESLTELQQQKDRILLDWIRLDWIVHLLMCSILWCSWVYCFWSWYTVWTCLMSPCPHSVRHRRPPRVRRPSGRPVAESGRRRRRGDAHHCGITALKTYSLTLFTLGRPTQRRLKNLKYVSFDLDSCQIVRSLFYLVLSEQKKSRRSWTWMWRTSRTNVFYFILFYFILLISWLISLW